MRDEKMETFLKMKDNDLKNLISYLFCLDKKISK